MAALPPKPHPAPLPGRGLLLPAVWLILAATLCLPAGSAAGPEAGAAALPRAPVADPADFDACARLALKQSPYFTKSALEIEVRRLDETDSKSEYLPTVNLRAKYYFSQPSRANLANPTDYTLDFAIESFNPVVAHYGVKIRQLLKQVAVLTHLKVISEGLKQLGHGFLELEALSRLAALQDQMLALAGQQATYARRRLDLGEATSLEVKIAAQEAEVAEVEKARLLAARRRLQERLRSFLGLEPHHGLQFETRESRRQVLGGKDGVDWENVQPRFFDGRIEALKKELQSWNLTLSKLRLLPGLTAAVQTPDPIALTGVKGYFFSVGLTWPVFDGFRRFRDISRQRTILAQAEAQDEVKTREARQQWREALDHVKAAAAARQLARSRLELARLQERQAELKYQGGDPLGQTLAGQRRRLESEGQVILKDLEHDQAVLEVRHLAGDLIHGYVSESSWLP